MCFSLLTLRTTMNNSDNLTQAELSHSAQKKKDSLVSLMLNSTKLLSRYTVTIPRTLPHQLHNSTRCLVMYVMSSQYAMYALTRLSFLCEIVCQIIKFFHFNALFNTSRRTSGKTSMCLIRRV